MYRGLLTYGDTEIANTSRVVSHLQGDGVGMCGCGGLQVDYDDSWPGMKDLYGVEEWSPLSSPWYDPLVPASLQFVGMWVMQVEGMDAVPVSREVAESVCDGGVAARHRDVPRVITVEALLIGCTAVGVQFGLDWVSRKLRKGRTLGSRGEPLSFLVASPEGFVTDPMEALGLFRSMVDVVLTKEVTVTERGRGYGAAVGREAQILRVTFELTATNPYMYGQESIIPVAWTSDVALPVQWTTGCVSAECSTGPGPLLDPACAPVVAPAVEQGVLSCAPSARVPLCAGRRRVWTLTGSVEWNQDRIVDLVVQNTGAAPVRGVSLRWVPVGADVECYQVGSAVIGYLPAGGEIVLDGVRGRAKAMVGGVPVSAAAVVSAGRGGPWRPAVLNSGSWQLVMDSEADAALSVTVVSRGRDS